jgi:mono/diheme cytochrome c family protein
MKVTVNRLKTFAIALIALPLLTALMLNSASVPTRAAIEDFDAAATFKAKCAMCHGATADKHFDPAKPEEQLVEAILKGKKAEKPPNMPAYEEKGINADQAKALVNFMKQAKTPKP